MLVQAASADMESMAQAHVWVDVVPNVAVGIADSQVDIGGVQTGDFVANITFRIDANMEDVDLQPVVSELYKGDDPTGQEVTPIPVKTEEGVLIDPVNANPTNGASPVAVYVGDTEIDGFVARQFSAINFESSQNGHFSQDVVITVTWNQPDPEKPQGEYSGFVQLYCFMPI